MIPIKSEYYRLNGEVWELYYFKTSADVIVETASYKVMTSSERQKISDYLSSFNIANKLAQLDTSGKLPSGVIPSLSYLPLTGGTITGNINLSNNYLQNVAGIHFNSQKEQILLNSNSIKLVTGGASVLETKVDAGGTNPRLDMLGSRIVQVGAPINLSDAATKEYVDAVSLAGVKPVEAVVTATTLNITTSGLITVDGYTLKAGDRVLVWKQTTKSQNGIYTVASGAWTKVSNDSVQGSYVFVENGNTHNDWYFFCKDQDGTWVDTGRPDTVKAGSGLNKSGTTINISLNGVTDEMLAGNISVSKIGNFSTTDVATIVDDSSKNVQAHLNNLYSIIKGIRGTANAYTPVTDTIASVKSLALGRNRILAGSTVPTTATGYTTGDVYLKTL